MLNVLLDRVPMERRDMRTLCEALKVIEGSTRSQRARPGEDTSLHGALVDLIRDLELRA